jgi:hypothetical protein
MIASNNSFGIKSSGDGLGFSSSSSMPSAVAAESRAAASFDSSKADIDGSLLAVSFLDKK